MNQSDDQVSSKPFVGDETGTIFNAPDVVLQSPTTTERVIDTQSGFLVVIKHLGIRDTLSVRRRIGTPPSSSILLTPDESLRLAQILTEERPDQPSTAAFNVKLPKRELNHLVDKVQDQDVTDSLALDFNSAKKSISSRRAIKIAGAATVLFALLIIALWAFKDGLMKDSHPARLTEAEVESHVDQFARNYITYLLDFNPQTYRFSQIQAMSSMSAELLDKYWQETHFPISIHQLQSSGQTHSLTVNKVLQEKPDSENLRLVEVFAEMKSKQNATIHPIHLQLKLETPEQGGVRVLAQKDLG